MHKNLDKLNNFMGCTTGLEYVKIFMIGNINQCYNVAGAARTNNFFNLKLKIERGKIYEKVH